MKQIYKKNKNNFSQLLLIGLLLIGITSCSKTSRILSADIGESSSTQIDLEALRAYKKSKHQIMGGYFRTWRDYATDPIVNKTSMKELPDSLDIAFVFNAHTPDDNAFWTTLKEEYVPHLRERGTKVIMTVDIGEVLNRSYANTLVGYELLAKKIIAERITKYDLDGIDFDVERYFTNEEIERAIGVFKALSKYLGPKSNSGKLLIYDTNQDGNTALFRAIHPLIDYVLVQSYGRSYRGLQSTYDSYNKKLPTNKYLIGFSFYEERGARWGDLSLPLNRSRAYYYAKWQPTQGNKAGIFSYAIDRDGVAVGQDQIVATNYDITRNLISIMNPAK